MARHLHQGGEGGAVLGGRRQCGVAKVVGSCVAPPDPVQTASNHLGRGVQNVPPARRHEDQVVRPGVCTVTRAVLAYLQGARTRIQECRAT